MRFVFRIRLEDDTLAAYPGPDFRSVNAQFSQSRIYFCKTTGVEWCKAQLETGGYDAASWECLLVTAVGSPPWHSLDKPGALAHGLPDLFVLPRELLTREFFIHLERFSNGESIGSSNPQDSNPLNEQQEPQAPQYTNAASPFQGIETAF